MPQAIRRNRILLAKHGITHGTPVWDLQRQKDETKSLRVSYSVIIGRVRRKFRILRRTTIYNCARLATQSKVRLLLLSGLIELKRCKATDSLVTVNVASSRSDLHGRDGERNKTYSSTTASPGRKVESTSLLRCRFFRLRHEADKYNTLYFLVLQENFGFERPLSNLT